MRRLWLLGVPQTRCPSVDLGDCFLDEHAATEQVEVPDPECGELGPAESAVAEDQHDQPSGAGRSSERLHLCSGEVAPTSLLERRQSHPERGVEDQAAVPHRQAEDPGQHAVGLPDRRPGEAAIAEFCKPGLHVAVRHADQRDASPAGQQVAAQDVVVAGPGGGL